MNIGAIEGAISYGGIVSGINYLDCSPLEGGIFGEGCFDVGFRGDFE